MPLISFSVFKEKLADGSKTQTIRKLRKYPVKQNDPLYLWWKSRTPQREKLFETTCSETFNIKLYIDEKDIDAAIITKQGDLIGFPPAYLTALALRDGFRSSEEMRQWFFKTYGKISGDVFSVIRWDAFKGGN